jgi:small subunit ribosomal protein S9
MLRRSSIRVLTNAFASRQASASTQLLQNTPAIIQTRALSTRTNNKHNQKRFTNPNLRTHAVSFIDGDYSDFDDDLTGHGYDDPFADDADWEIAPKEGVNDEDEEEDTLWRRKQENEALEAQQAEDAKRQKWIENAKPPVRVQEIDERGRAYGRGGRKTSTARVWIQPGEGLVTVNNREFLDFFGRETDRELILSPFVATNTCGKFDVVVAVEGGGVTGKAGAIRHGIARALEKYNPDYRPPMKRLGFMTRDARMVERKKIGLKKARKAPQWVRR